MREKDKIIKVICPFCYYINNIKEKIFKEIDSIECNKCNKEFKKEMSILFKSIKIKKVK
jgi:hypothetical protein